MAMPFTTPARSTPSASRNSTRSRRCGVTVLSIHEEAQRDAAREWIERWFLHFKQLGCESCIHLFVVRLRRDPSNEGDDRHAGVSRTLPNARRNALAIDLQGDDGVGIFDCDLHGRSPGNVSSVGLVSRCRASAASAMRRSSGPYSLSSARISFGSVFQYSPSAGPPDAATSRAACR